MPAAVAVAALAGQMAGGTHTVQKGDTLWSLSQRYDTTVEAMAAGNSIADPDLILIGQELEIPGRNAGRPAPDPGNDRAPAMPRPTPAAAPTPAAQTPAETPSAPPDNAPAPAAAAGSGPAAAAGGSHTVGAGDTLWSIAQANATTVEVLAAVNDLDGNSVAVGQVIDLPSNGPTPSAAPAPTAPTPAPAATTTSVVSIYRVQPGDTATSIASLFSVSVDSLLRINQLSSAGEIVVGEYVRIPSS